MSERLRRKDLKGPDEFLSGTQRAIDYAQENPTRVVLAVVAIVLVTVAALGVRVVREWRMDAARDALSAAQRTFAQGNLEEAARAFEAVPREHRGSRQADVALLSAGNAWIELGKKDEARAAFRRLVETTSEPGLRQMALYNLGLLERDAGESEAAAERLRAAARESGPLQGAAWLAVRTLDGEIANDGEIPEGVSAGAREWLEGRGGR